MKVIYCDNGTLENTEIREYACSVYENYASHSPDGLPYPVTHSNIQEVIALYTQGSLV